MDMRQFNQKFWNTPFWKMSPESIILEYDSPSDAELKTRLKFLFIKISQLLPRTLKIFYMGYGNENEF